MKIRSTFRCRHNWLSARQLYRKLRVPEITHYANLTRQPGWQGARTDDLQIRGQQLLVFRIDRPFVIPGVRRQHNGFPPKFSQMLGEKTNPQRGRVAAGSEIGTHNQDSFTTVPRSCVCCERHRLFKTPSTVCTNFFFSRSQLNRRVPQFQDSWRACWRMFLSSYQRRKPHASAFTSPGS